MPATRGTDIQGSAARHKVGIPALHASDLEDAAYLVHMDPAAAAGTAMVMGAGGAYVATDIVTQAELPHAVLSATHNDTTAAAAVRGDLIVGIGASPLWTRYPLSVPAANLMNVLGVVNGEVEPTWKALLDGTNPATLTVSAAAAPGTATIAAHRDHVHPITSSANPGAAASILATDASGYVTVAGLGIGAAPLYPLLVTGVADVIQVAIRGVSGQTAVLQTWQYFNGATVASMAQNGTLDLLEVHTASIALINGASAYGASPLVLKQVSGNYGLVIRDEGGVTDRQCLVGFEPTLAYAHIWAIQQGVGVMPLVLGYLTLSQVGIGIVPTARLHVQAGSASASTAPLKFTSGTLLTTAEAGAVEFLTDDFFATITTGAARKAFVLDDGARLTATRVPFATTNGRLVDDADLTFATDTLSATKVAASGGVTTQAVDFTASTPDALGGDVNNWDLGNNTFIRASGGAADRIVTGIVARASGHLLIFQNIGTTNKITFANESASSTAANRLINANAGSTEITPNHCIVYIYDATTARWREITHL